MAARRSRPREIDDVLLRHPAVAQAVTFAVPDARLGEEVGAAVVLVEARRRRRAGAAGLRGSDGGAVQGATEDRPRRRDPKGATGKLQRIGLARAARRRRRTRATRVTRPPRRPSPHVPRALDGTRLVRWCSAFPGSASTTTSSRSAATRSWGRRRWPGSATSPAGTTCRSSASCALRPWPRSCWSSSTAWSARHVTRRRSSGERGGAAALPRPRRATETCSDSRLSPGVSATERPFYGLRARGVEGSGPLHRNIDEMASAYLEEVTHVQPAGPICSGGCVREGRSRSRWPGSCRSVGKRWRRWC